MGCFVDDIITFMQTLHKNQKTTTKNYADSKKPKKQLFPTSPRSLLQLSSPLCVISNFRSKVPTGKTYEARIRITMCLHEQTNLQGSSLLYPFPDILNLVSVLYYLSQLLQAPTRRIIRSVRLEMGAMRNLNHISHPICI